MDHRFRLVDEHELVRTILGRHHLAVSNSGKEQVIKALFVDIWRLHSLRLCAWNPEAGYGVVIPFGDSSEPPLVLQILILRKAVGRSKEPNRIFLGNMISCDEMH